MAEVDVFSPFRRRPDHHEDRLTWGFLVALKYSPTLQRFVRRLALRGVPAKRWPSEAGWEPAAISTQTSRLPAEASFVISVLISDARLDDVVGVKPSSRGARYDGVIEYPDGLVLVIENKPRSADVWTGQLSPSRASFHSLSDEVELFEEAISLEWADLMEGVLSYSNSPVGSYSERSVASDFLSFAVELHPQLSPYRTFELCGQRPEALARRTNELLKSLGEGLAYDVGVRPGSKVYLELPFAAVRQLHISVVESPTRKGLVLRAGIWPGDTATQARAFLDQVDTRTFLDLPNQDWEIATNLHFSHFQKHLVWAHSRVSLPEYLGYFQSNRDEIGRTSFGAVELEDLIARWRELGFISPTDEDELRQRFGETRRGYIIVVPGFRLTREWPLSGVIELEAEQRLEATLVEALRIPLATWGESLPEWERISS